MAPESRLGKQLQLLRFRQPYTPPKDRKFYRLNPRQQCAVGVHEQPQGSPAVFLNHAE